MMTEKDQQLLFTALGFLAVTMQDGMVRNGGSDRVVCFAALLEDFCRMKVPEAFTLASDAEEAVQQDRFIALCLARLRGKGGVELPEDRNALIRLYSRLAQRHVACSSETSLAEDIRQMMAAELAGQDADV